jgi:hypothetical protein
MGLLSRNAISTPVLAPRNREAAVSCLNQCSCSPRNLRVTIAKPPARLRRTVPHPTGGELPLMGVGVDGEPRLCRATSLGTAGHGLQPTNIAMTLQEQ